MVPPPNSRGHGQIDPDLLIRLRKHPHIITAQPLVDVDLRAPVRASQATVKKSQVDRVPRISADSQPGGIHYRPPAASPFEGGVHLYDGHHRAAHAMLRGHATLPMAVYDPDNPQHVTHHAAVAAHLKTLQEPLHEHRRQVIQSYGFVDRPNQPPHPDAPAARTAFTAHQNEVMAKVERFKADARTRWMS